MKIKLFSQLCLSQADYLLTTSRLPLLEDYLKIVYIYTTYRVCLCCSPSL